MVDRSQSVLVCESYLGCLVNPKQWIQQLWCRCDVSISASDNKTFICNHLLVPKSVPRISAKFTRSSRRDSLKSSRCRHVLIKVCSWVGWLQVCFKVMYTDVLSCMHFEKHLKFIRVELCCLIVVVLLRSIIVRFRVHDTACRHRTLRQNRQAVVTLASWHLGWPLICRFRLPAQVCDIRSIHLLSVVLTVLV